MKKRNRFLALALAVTLSLSLSACGGKASDSKSAEDAGSSAVEEDVSANEQEEEAAVPGKEDVFAAAQENLAAVTSLDAQMVMEMDMEVTAEGQTESVSSITTMDMTSFADPFRMKMDMTVDMGDQGSAESSIYAEIDEEGNCIMYVYDGSSWQSQTVPAAALGEYNAASDMDAYLDGGYDFEEAGIEQINGVDAYKYTAVITGDEVKETMLSSGALDSVSQYGITASDLESMMDDLGEIPLSLWIDSEDFYPVKYELDMTVVMDAMMSRIPEMLASAGIEAEDMVMRVPKMIMSMTCFHYDSATEFEVPEEAKAD